MQLAFINGRVMLVDDAKEFKVGDSVIIDEKKTIKKHLPFAKGASVQLIGGRHMGARGTIADIAGNTIIVNVDGQEFETLKKYGFVTGTKTEEVKVL